MKKTFALLTASVVGMLGVAQAQSAFTVHLDNPSITGINDGLFLYYSNSGSGDQLQVVNEGSFDTSDSNFSVNDPHASVNSDYTFLSTYYDDSEVEHVIAGTNAAAIKPNSTFASIFVSFTGGGYTEANLATAIDDTTSSVATSYDNQVLSAFAGDPALVPPLVHYGQKEALVSYSSPQTIGYIQAAPEPSSLLALLALVPAGLVAVRKRS